MKQLNATEFAEQVLAPSLTEPVAVLFTASWCGPCKVVKPRIERMAALYGFDIVAVDAGEEKALAASYGVRAVPSLAVFDRAALSGVAAGAGNLSEAMIIDFLNFHDFDLELREGAEA